jgi:hypothetical protein
MEASRLGDSTLPFLIGKLAPRGAGSIGIATPRVVQKKIEYELGQLIPQVGEPIAVKPWG